MSHAYWRELSRAVHQPHEAWLVMGTLGPVFGDVYRAIARDLADERASGSTGSRSPDYVIAAKAMNYFSISARGVLGLLCAAVFLVVAFTGDTWLAEVGLTLGWAAALGALTSLLRVGVLSIWKGRPARILEPWNADLIWQLIVVAFIVSVWIA